MKLSINRAALLGALSAAMSAVKQRPSLAVLTNVRMSTGTLPDGTPALRVEATDLDITIAAVAPLNPLEIDASGTFLTDAKRIFDAVKAFSGENVSIDARPDAPRIPGFLF